ncbi:MAG: hypothetical protein F6K18_10775 [Okeania sp. SIO2C2]|uniref:hypothetical protein n=1 Tax=Okeania sp. SIO2C2 TaxID=2607787 RepID=UPI0013BD953D|nr:hypothetical protein [Okeania sp. SIO2C2]NEP87272.1 hypothetical protein [Okeania sp. SIO2C2]
MTSRHQQKPVGANGHLLTQISALAEQSWDNFSEYLLIILMFASPPLPHSPTQQNVEKFLRNGIISEESVSPVGCVNEM